MTGSARSSDGAASDGFYGAIRPVDHFDELARSESYVPLPDDWSIVAADVSGSTRAIESGRYKEVNTVGVSVIAAVRNAVRPIEVPFVFGGDGALLCVPSRLEAETRDALAATVAMARDAFQLRLRAGIAPVSYVRGRGHEVLVARQRVSEHYVQCALFGGGADFVESSLKADRLPEEFVVDADPACEADYGGLECRWREIPSPAEETVAVIVDAAGEPPTAFATYRWVIERIGDIYGDADRCRPVTEAGLSVTLDPFVLSNEMRAKHARAPFLTRLKASLGLRLAVIAGWYLFRFRVRTESTDWGDYKPDLVRNTDFRKIDGTLRLVLTGSPAQRSRLTAFLDRLRRAGELQYGIHPTTSALMTCLIEKRQGAHFHFVDAAGGGYAAAALDLKRRATTGPPPATPSGDRPGRAPRKE